MKDIFSKKVWITWDNHRRSIELSRKLSCNLIVIENSGKLRYLLCISKTIAKLIELKPSILFVQNPSMILAVIACLYGIFTKNFIVVDRHTTFRINKKPEFTFDYFVFLLFNKFTIKYANVTIVTNKYLANIVKNNGGNPCILPDVLPEIKPSKIIYLPGNFNILFICTYAKDEPVDTVFEAVKTLDNNDINLYVTGNYLKSKYNPDNVPKNIHLTGFLNDQDYINLLYSVDAVIVLTTSDHVMLCGCYEAISAKKPLITSNKTVLTEYFINSIYVDNTVEQISSAMNLINENYDKYFKEIENISIVINNKWEKLYKKLNEKFLEYL